MSLLPMVAWGDVVINEENFPDANFRNWLLNQSYGYDGVLTANEIADVKNMSVADRYIQSLKGIEYFTALNTLLCYRNQLTELDVSQNTALTNLSCNENQLTALDVTKNTALTILGCNGNKLTELDVSQNTALTSLSCTGNQLTTLDLSKCTALTTLNCYSNSIKEAGMDALVESLPVVNNGKMYVIYNQKEQNEMTKTQVAAAKAKGWIPQWMDPNYGWCEYGGTGDFIPEFANLTYSAGEQSSVKMTVKTGTVTLFVAAEEGWAIETLTVNGTDKLGELRAGRLALKVEGDTEVRVTYCWANAEDLYTEDYETGVATIEGEGVKVFVIDGQICIDGAAGRPVRLCTLGGALIKAVTPQASDKVGIFSVPAGTYIVQVGKKAAKVLVK